MEIKRSIKRSFAVLGAIGMLVLAGCGGGSGGGGTAAKTEKPGIVKLVEEKGKNLTVNTVKLKYVVLASEVKKLKPPSYMPTLVYQKDAFYGIDKATKSMVKLVIKDGTFVVENANVIPNVQYIFGTDGENIYYRPEGKMPTPRVLTKDGKDGGSLFKNYYAYVSPAKDGKTAFAWSNSGTILKLKKKADGTFDDPRRPFPYLPKEDRYVTAGWFDVGTDSFFVRGRQKSRKQDQPLREHRFDGTLKTTYGQIGPRQNGTYAILKDYVINARFNGAGYDIYSRSDGKVKGNIPLQTFGTNTTLMAPVVDNTFVICDSFRDVPKLIVLTIK